jgi:hypothetical protein
MSSSRETESSKDLYNQADEDSVIHHAYEKERNDELISTARSFYSRASRKGAKILQGITKPSMVHLLTPGPRTEASTLRFKSAYPHVSLKCEFFKNLDKGWLHRRFDSTTSNTIMFANFGSMALLKYDIKNYKFGLEDSVLELKDDFFGAFVRLSELSNHLVCFSSYKGNPIRVADYHQNKIFCSISSSEDHKIALCTTMSSSNSQVFAGFANSTTSLFDIRTSKPVFSKVFPRDSQFNPVLRTERLDNYLLISLRDSIHLIDFRAFNRDLWHSSTTLSFDEGVNVAQFFSLNGKSTVAYTRIGDRAIRFYDIQKNRPRKNILKLRRKVLAFASNFKDQELAVLEGSEQLCVSFHKSYSETYVDQLGVQNDSLDISFNVDNNSMLSFGTQCCNVYSFENDQLADEFEKSVHLNPNTNN